MGFPPHHDTLDAAAVQVAGAKRWQIWNRQIEHPIWRIRDHSQPVDGVEHDLEVDLEPGDVLFIRLGDPHRAICTSPPSLHLTVGVRRPNGHDFLSWLVDGATDLPQVREPMPWASTGRDACADRVAWTNRLLNQLVDFLATDADAGWLDAFLNERVALVEGATAVSLKPRGPLSSDSQIQVAHPQLACRLSEGALIFDRRRIRLPPDLIPAVKLLVDDRQHRWVIADLAAAAEVESRRLVLLMEILADNEFVVLHSTSVSTRIQ